MFFNFMNAEYPKIGFFWLIFANFQYLEFGDRAKTLCKWFNWTWQGRIDVPPSTYNRFVEPNLLCTPDIPTFNSNFIHSFSMPCLLADPFLRGEILFWCSFEKALNNVAPVKKTATQMADKILKPKINSNLVLNLTLSHNPNSKPNPKP